MQAVRESQQTDDEKAWPEVQYLWPLNPIFDWVNDKASLIFPRGEAPLAFIHKLKADQVIFLLNGSIPNRKSTPLVDKWFGLLYEKGQFAKALPLEEALSLAGIYAGQELPNPTQEDEQTLAQKQELEHLLPDVIMQAKKYLTGFYTQYQQQSQPQIDAEIDKLARLEDRHKAYQMSLFQNRAERQRDEKVREIEDIFNSFSEWVEDSMTIENHPYIRVLGVLSGKQEG